MSASFDRAHRQPAHQLVLGGPAGKQHQQLAHAAAALLREIVIADDVVGVGHGRTLTVMAEKIDGLAACPVVQLTGALRGVNVGENGVEPALLAISS